MAQQLGPLRLLVRSRAQALVSLDLLPLRESERLQQGGLRVAVLSPSLCGFGCRWLIFFSDSTLRCKNHKLCSKAKDKLFCPEKTYDSPLSRVIDCHKGRRGGKEKDTLIRSMF